MSILRPPSAELRRSATAYLVLMLALVAVKLAIIGLTAASPGFRHPAQAAVFAWPAIGIFTVVGLLGVWLADQVGLPGVWSDSIPLRRRLVVPLGIGLALGAVAVGIDLATGWSAISAAAMGLPSIHIAWPASIFIYSGGAVIVNVIYYLVPIPLLVWLVTRLVRDPARFGAVYWSVGTVAALIEPVTQAMGNGLSGHPGAVAAFMTQATVENLAQVATFRRAGFGATVALRVGLYLVWHVGYGLAGG